MVTTLGVVSVILIAVIVFQLSRSSELLKALRGENPNELSYTTNRTQAILLVVFMVVGLAATVGAYFAVKGDLMLTNREAASAHGVQIDDMFFWTSAICGVVFFITQALLFWFAFKYRARKGHKAEHFAHDNKLEVVWTVIPAITLTILVAMGIEAWYNITDPASEDARVVEVTAEQFKWTVRYPGADDELGKREFLLIDGVNTLGMDFEDERCMDDMIVNEIHLEVGKEVVFKLGAKDVLHSFYLPDFRVKMDCVPGIPTHFKMTPTITTQEMRDKMDDQTYDYYLACAELCGKGHWNMKVVIVVEDSASYQTWLAEQKPYYELVKDQLKANNAPQVEETPEHHDTHMEDTHMEETHSDSTDAEDTHMHDDAGHDGEESHTGTESTEETEDIVAL